jgi:hypothetical protein
MMLAISILALLVGLALLALGLRGRVIDNHPLCRKCGFDLTGRSPDSTRCPECGAELSLPKAICIGHRKPRSFSLSLGCLLFGVAACGIFFQFSAIQWTRYAPTWWLIHRIDSADTVARDEAVAELDLRIIAGNVSSARALDLVDRILALQADLKKTWVENWGTLVEDAHVRKQVPDDRWNRYLLQAPRLALDVRSDIRIGDPVPFMVRCEQARLGAGTMLFL